MRTLALALLFLSVANSAVAQTGSVFTPPTKAKIAEFRSARTAPESWSQDGFRDFRWGMGSGDVLALLGPKARVVDHIADAMVAVDSSDTLFGMSYVLRFYFSHKSSGLYSVQIAPRP